MDFYGPETSENLHKFDYSSVRHFAPTSVTLTFTTYIATSYITTYNQLSIFWLKLLEPAQHKFSTLTYIERSLINHKCIKKNVGKIPNQNQKFFNTF